jgi:hypothetical protein
MARTSKNVRTSFFLTYTLFAEASLPVYGSAPSCEVTSRALLFAIHFASYHQVRRCAERSSGSCEILRHASFSYNGKGSLTESDRAEKGRDRSSRAWA